LFHLCPCLSALNSFFAFSSHRSISFFLKSGRTRALGGGRGLGMARLFRGIAAVQRRSRLHVMVVMCSDWVDTVGWVS
jgi:hypothetical protein